MALSVKFDARDGVTSIVMSDWVTRQDYRKLMPHLEALVDDTGPLKLLIQVREFKGWAPGNLQGAALANLGDLEHVASVAICSSEDWRGVMYDMALRSCGALCQTFLETEEASARMWLSAQDEISFTAVKEELRAS